MDALRPALAFFLVLASDWVNRHQACSSSIIARPRNPVAAAAVDAFRKRGLTVTDVTKSDTKVNLANITDPYMGRVELVEITPDSLHAKAIARWK